MLVLTRKASEQIMIGNDITVTITRVEGGQVRVGIEAPPEILIRRAELVTQWHDEAPVTTRAWK
jgi:carbon storage regulator